MSGTDASRRLKTWTGEGFGLLNETIDWLVALKTSSNTDDQKQADDFIDTYLEHRANFRRYLDRDVGPATKELAEASQAIEGAMDGLIKAKAAMEDRNKANEFHTKRGFDTADLNGYISERLADHTHALIRKIVIAEVGSDHPQESKLVDAMSKVTSIGALRKRVLRRYNADPSEENFALVSEALTLDHAINSLDDLTKFDDEADKNKAIGMLGAELDGLLKKSKVYVNDMIEGNLSRRDSDGTLELTPLIKQGMSKVVKANMLKAHVVEAMEAIVADASPDPADGDAAPKGKLRITRKYPKMISDYGGAEIDWVDKHYDSKARQEYFKARADKANYVVKPKSRAKKNLRARDKEKSIGAMLEKVLNARAENLQKQRHLDRQKRQRQASSTGN